MFKNNKHRHSCRICGEWKAIEKHKGERHSCHICKTCYALPPEWQKELQHIIRIGNIADNKYHCSKADWELLEKYAENRTYPDAMELARSVLGWDKPGVSA